MTIKKYSLNLKTGYIFGYYQHKDGLCTNFDSLYAFKNREDLKMGFKTVKEAKEYYDRTRTTTKKRRIIKKTR